MVLTIHQPEHLPWLGFFNKMATADEFVILDSVQYEKNYFQNRNRVMGSNGVQWLSVPVDMKGHMGKRICDMTLAIAGNPKWQQKYLKTIEYSYKKHPYFDVYFPFFEELLGREQTSLYELNTAIIFYFAGELGLHPKFIRSSELNVEGLKSNLILDICRETGTTTYVAGPSGRDYLSVDEFKNAGIEVVYNDFIHPEYPQKGSNGFVPYLSTLDLLMNVGSEEARKIICETNFWSKK